MSSAVHLMYKPDPDAMLMHVEHLFGGWLPGCEDGLVELAWTDTVPDASGKYSPTHAQLYGTDRLEELVAEAAKLNAAPYCNVYIGAALRHPDTAPFGRTKDVDAWALTADYTDLDDEGAYLGAKAVYGDSKPTLIVQTGIHPHGRAQLWWRLDEPQTDPVAWSAQLRGIATAMAGDSTVTNPGRLMRLAGSIAWPVKPGRVVEVTCVVPLKKPGPPIYMPEHLAIVFPPDVTHNVTHSGVEARTSASFPLENVTHRGALGILPSKLDDGRERYMLSTVLACMVEFIGTHGAVPTEQELFDAAWPQYERHVDFSRPGRGPGEMLEKCRYTLKRFEHGDLRGLRNLDEVVAAYRKKRSAYLAAPESVREARAPKVAVAAVFPLPDPSRPLLLTAAQFVAGFTPPQYLIDGIVQRGYLYSLTARTGHGKTVVSMFFSQAITRGVPVHGRKVLQGSVLFLAGENPDDIRARYLVLADRHGFDAAGVPFHFLAGVVDLSAAMPRIHAEVASIPDLRLVVVDTAAAYFRGDDSNSNAQQGGYARLLRQLTFLPGLPAVIVNSHPVKNAMRDNLLPVGGGAFVNEVDGNLTLWSGVEQQTEFHWQGKFRGPEFEPLTFRMETVTCDAVRDAEGRLMPSVVATPIGEMEVSMKEQETEDSDNRVLRCIGLNEKITVARIASQLGWLTTDGKPQKSRVFRAIMRLRDDKLIEKSRGGKTRITTAGRKEIGLENIIGMGRKRDDD